jgi:hypothetical protein
LVVIGFKAGLFDNQPSKITQRPSQNLSTDNPAFVIACSVAKLKRNAPRSWSSVDCNSRISRNCTLKEETE